MLRILFIRSRKAFLPEINAYMKYFSKRNEFEAFDSFDLQNDYEIDDFDIIWEFKGFGGMNNTDKVLVHEYASLSTGYFPRLKNRLKLIFNPKPHLRVFLNETVRHEFGFKDDVDYCYRDMGIDESFLHLRTTGKEYDFVYVGSVSKSREIDILLREYTKCSPGKLCLIGNVDDEIYSTYKRNKDIIFTGPVPYSEVPLIASKATYGINYVPNKYPFNIQTSTKLLEYLALGLKVITTDYSWVREFEKKHGCNFYKLDHHNISFDMNKIEKHNFVSDFKPEDYLWDNIIERAGIAERVLDICQHVY